MMNKRHIKNLLTVIGGLFFIGLGLLNLVSPARNLDNLFGALMIIYGVGSIALFPDWRKQQ